MSHVSDQVETHAIEDEVRVCPNCGYGRGFHVSFLPQQRAKGLKLILICPNCGHRLDIGKTV